MIDRVSKTHDKVIHITDDLVQGTSDALSKYQKIAEKAIKKSEPIMEKQLDLLFDSVEFTVEQFQSGSKRLQKLFGVEDQITNAKKRVNKLFNKVSDELEEKVEDTKAAVKKVTSSRKPVAKSTTKSTTAKKAPTAKTTSKSTAARKTTTKKATAQKSTAAAK